MRHFHPVRHRFIMGLWSSGTTPHSSRFINFGMFYFYVLKSQINDSYYFGVCRDFGIRLKQHNQGLVKSTKRYRPWRLVYIENFDSLGKARKRELQVKSWKKRNAIEKLIKHSKI